MHPHLILPFQMRRKADNAADFPQSAATTHTPFFLRISPYGGFFVSSTQFFVLDADCQKNRRLFRGRDVSSIIDHRTFHAKIQKNLNRNLTPLITLNIVILFFAKS